MIRTVLVSCVALLLSVAPLRAQHRLSARQISRLPLVQLPVQHNDSLLAREVRQRKPGRPQTFAVSLPVHLSPATDGSWSRRGGLALWQLRIGSKGAKSLNLGFGRFRLPPGAALYLSTDRERYGPFTAADNEAHEQLWTPLLRGDELVVELEVPAGQEEAVELLLTTVNHDFEGAIDLLSDDCHLDVACGAADGYPQVDAHRDVIRSVAAYTLQGRLTCTGFLVNNSNQDGRPLFLTANHCGVDAESAPTIVTYWNFENRTCRAPGSEESGGKGNGSLEVFNTGARLLASHGATDVTLIELDEPVNPRARVFFAGWDAGEALPDGGVFTVHHPRLDEKRISFADDPVDRSTVVGQLDADGNYLRVPQWDLGSTEGGSSGAPLFDADGRVRGQLFGGRASCSTPEEDMFGWLHLSWTGGGTPATRLSDWLDPCGTTGGRLGGLDEGDLAVSLYTSQSCLSACGGDTVTFELSLGNRFPAGTRLTIAADPALTVAAPDRVGGGGTFIVAASGNGAPAGNYTLRISAAADGLSDVLSVDVNLTDATPAAPRALLPEDDAPGVDPFVRMTWSDNPAAEAYQLQYARRQDFATVEADLADLHATEYTPDYPLPGETRYYWRVRTRNTCGYGPWSAVRSFVTLTRTCVLTTGEALPVPIPFAKPTEVSAEVIIDADLDPADLEVIVGIEHTFLGDLAVRLVAPDGTSIKLFDPLEEGSCPARNLYAVFSDEGTVSAVDFSERCADGDDNDYLRVRPLESLSAFTGSSARGTWKLIVDDEAAMDGGAITDFRLRICEDRVDADNRYVSLRDVPSFTCATERTTAILQLTGDYSSSPQLRVEVGSTVVDNYTYTLNASAKTITVTFTDWTAGGGGAREITYTVTDADGSERRAVHSLEVQSPPTSVTPLPARFLPELILFSWPSAPAADRYTLQFAPTEDFTEVRDSVVTRNRQIALPRDSVERDLFWRVVAVNTCGRTLGPPRAVSADTTNATHMLDAGVTIAIFPNPTRGSVTVKRDGPAGNAPLRAELYSAEGRRLRSWPASDGHLRVLDFGPIPPGLYYLRLSGEFGQLTERLVVLE